MYGGPGRHRALYDLETADPLYMKQGTMDIDEEKNEIQLHDFLYEAPNEENGWKENITYKFTKVEYPNGPDKYGFMKSVEKQAVIKPGKPKESVYLEQESDAFPTFNFKEFINVMGTDH